MSTRTRLLLIVVAVAVALGVVGGLTLGGADRANNDDERAATAFVDEVRGADATDSLVRFDDAELIVKGEAFCAALATTGDPLEAASALQRVGDVYDGQTAVISGALAHLCPAG